VELTCPKWPWLPEDDAKERDWWDTEAEEVTFMMVVKKLRDDIAGI
jgi:hypothetical protein